VTLLITDSVSTSGSIQEVIKVSVKPKHFIPGVGDDGNAAILAIATVAIVASVVMVVVLLMKRRKDAKRRELQKSYSQEPAASIEHPAETPIQHPLQEALPAQREKATGPPETRLITIQDKLWQLRSLKEKGLISEGEFEAKTTELLKRL
jgi:hypothetical protein